MYNYILLTTLFFILAVNGCLITNCPRGGKRNGKFGNLSESNVKACISCGPGRTGQCFGPNICCGPFGCLINTPETRVCMRDGYFHEREPCIAGNGSCRKNTGRCAIDGVCCTQESCHIDKACSSEEKTRIQLTDNILPVDLYNFITEYGNEK